MLAPSRATARSGFSPARRLKVGISTSSRTSGARRRRWYSRNPALTQSGNRVPAAINRHFIRPSPNSGAGGALGCRQIPQFFEPVEFAHARQHDVHDHLVQIDEYPIAVLLTFAPLPPKPRFIGVLDM